MAIRSGRGGRSSVVELEFTFEETDYPFVGASAAESCEMELQEMVPRGDGVYAEFYSIRNADVDRILELATTHETVTPELIERYDDGGLVEFTVTGNCPAVGLAELGALPRTVYGNDGEGRIVAELPNGYDADEVTSTFLAEFGGELVAKRQHEQLTPLFSHREFDREIESRLTDRQREVLQTAFEAGYYDWPRETTGQELADQLGISPPTLSQHLSAAERKLLSLLFQRKN